MSFLNPAPRTLYAFIASPGDLVEERAAARDVVERVNRSLGRQLGVRIELLGWETTRPGYGRPQEQINAEVDVCGLFIGVLWERWGEETGDREHTSGFEEEFERARARREREGSPEIWMYLKEIGAGRQADPGPQLQKVLAFRERLRSEKELKYYAYPDLETWKDTLFEHLIGYVAVLAREGPTPEEGTLEPPEAFDFPVEREEVPAAQGVRAFESARNALSQPEPSASGRQLADADLARVYLAAATWMAERTGSTLENHELNFIYRVRRDVDPLVAELAQILRAVAGDRFSVRPGWFWLRSIPIPELALRIAGLAVTGTPDEVKISALALLRACEGWLDAAVDAGLDAEVFFAVIRAVDARDVQRAAYDFLAHVPDETAVAVLEAATSSDEPGHQAAREALLVRLARTSPAIAIERIVEWPSTSSDAVVKALETADHVDAADWRKLLSVHDESLVALAVAKLSDQLAEDELTRFLSDRRPKIVEAALNETFARGREINREELDKALKVVAPLPLGHAFDRSTELRRLWHARRSLGDLLADVNFYFGADPYYVLVSEHYADFQQQVRRDLGDEFETYRSESMDRAVAQFTDIARRLLEADEDMISYLRDAHIAVALDGLATRSDNPADRGFARKYLTHGSPAVRLAAVRLLRRAGSEEDVERLVGAVQAASPGDSDVKREAARAALELSPGAAGAARDLVALDDAEVANAVIGNLREDDVNSAVSLIGRLLGHPDAGVRRAAVAAIRDRVGDDALETLLDDVIATRPHYYNVVGWIDRVLYAPEPFRSAYRELMTA